MTCSEQNSLADTRENGYVADQLQMMMMMMMMMRW